MAKEEHEPTQEELIEAAVNLYAQLESVKAAAREVHEHATAYRNMLKLIHFEIRKVEQTGQKLTPLEARIREIIGSPEVTRAEQQKEEGR